MVAASKPLGVDGHDVGDLFLETNRVQTIEHMLNYNYHDLLSPYEFECFSRDLLNAHEGLDLSSFAEGRDGGIDLRYSNNKGSNVIVQAKRYKDYRGLKPKLQDEVEKVKKLQPKRYILTTSVDLTAADKLEIMSLFSPFIQAENDILGKQDLNKVLTLHPDVERAFFKLWLSSTNVLDTILHRGIVNWASFEKPLMQAAVKTYVMNDSFEDALQILQKFHYVIISGEPGIGKTTLARVLIMHLLSDKYKDDDNRANYQEFYYTNSNIEDLVSVFQEGRRQVFFYDDFMGQISFEEGERGFDRRLVSFIRACHASDDKMMILTSREYILQQGLVHYPGLSTGANLEIAKCVVDMGKYTRFVRAQMLYNHMVENDIPQEYINAILEGKNYLKIIDHPHFSPRIIEAFLSNKTHEYCAKEEYFERVLSFFDHPDSVWRDALRRLDLKTQDALFVLNSMPCPVLLDDWETAYNKFLEGAHKDANYLRASEWKDVVKVLHNNFIRTSQSLEGTCVDYHNPGVKEVLIRYINENESIRVLLLKHSQFIDQVFGVLDGIIIATGIKDIPEKYSGPGLDAFKRNMTVFQSCRLGSYKTGSGNLVFHRRPMSSPEALLRLRTSYASLLVSDPFFVERNATQEIMDGESSSITTLLLLLKVMDLSKTSLDFDTLFGNYCAHLNSSEDCLALAASINKVFPKHIDYLEDATFVLSVTDCLETDLQNVSGSN